MAEDGDSGNDWPDQAGVFGGAQADPPELRISRQTARKAIRGSSIEFRHERQVQPRPRLGAFVARLDAMLAANSKRPARERPARERLTAQRLFELLRAEGYQGAYDSVYRHVHEWRRQQSQQGSVFIPLCADSGDVARSFRDHVARCSDMMSPAWASCWLLVFER